MLSLPLVSQKLSAGEAGTSTRAWAISNLALFRHASLPVGQEELFYARSTTQSRSRITSLQDLERNKTKVAKSSLPTASGGAEQL